MEACILAGGKSTRMGTDKAQLKFQGERFIDRIYKLLSKHCKEITISANHNYGIEEVKLISDHFQNQGPLAGICETLKQSNSESVFFIPCDTPNVNDEVIYRFKSIKNTNQIVIGRFNRVLQPLIGIYPKQVYPLMENAIIQQERSVKRFLEGIPSDQLHVVDFEQDILNINHPEEYRSLTNG